MKAAAFKTYVFGMVRGGTEPLGLANALPWTVTEVRHDFATAEEAMTMMREWNRGFPFGPGQFFFYWLKAVVESDEHWRRLA